MFTKKKKRTCIDSWYDYLVMKIEREEEKETSELLKFNIRKYLTN